MFLQQDPSDVCRGNERVPTVTLKVISAKF